MQTSFPRRCGPVRPHFLPGPAAIAVRRAPPSTPEGLSASRTYTPADAPPAPHCASSPSSRSPAAAGAVRSPRTRRPARRASILVGAPATLDPATPGRRLERRGHRPALRDADDVRRRPPAPARPGRDRGRSTRAAAGSSSPPARPAVLRRHATARLGRRPELAAPPRPGGAVAARQPRSSTSRARRPTWPATARRTAVGLHADDARGHRDGRPGAARRPSSSTSWRARRSPSCRPGWRDAAPALQPGDGFVASGGYVADRAVADGADPQGQPALLGRAAGDRDDHAGHGPRRREPGRGVRGRQRSTTRRSATSTRPGSATTRRSGRAPVRRRRCRPTTRLRHVAAAVRRRPRSARRSRAAVDWRRIARLAPRRTRPPSRPRWSRPGIPGRSDRDVVPAHDPDAARGPAGRGRLSGRRRLPGDHDAERRDRLRRGDRRRAPATCWASRSRPRRWTSTRTSSGSTTDPPQIWSLSLGRRLPGPQRLPRRAARDRAVEQLRASGARPSSTPRSPMRARPPIRPRPSRGLRPGRGRSSRRDAPVVPLSYGTGWALARDGLLGAGQNGLGIPRLAGLAWAQVMRPDPAGGASSPGVPRRSPRWCLPLVAGDRPAAALAADPSFGTPTITLHVREGDRPHPAGDARRRRSPRVEALVTFADAPGPHVIEVRPAVDQPAPVTLPRHDRRDRRRPHPAEHAAVGALAADAAGDVGRRRSWAPRSAVVYADDRFTWKTKTGIARPGPLVRGRRRVRRSGRSRSARRPCSRREALLGVTETEPGRLLHLRRPGGVLRRARAGDARERRRPGRRRDPDAVRAHHARTRSTTPGSASSCRTS